MAHSSIMPGKLSHKIWCGLLGLYMLAGCSTIGGGPGCNPDPDVPPRIASAQKASCSGNRSASLTVGDHYFTEAERTGNDKLYKRAARFYERAAETRSGQTFIYVPGAGKVPGYTMPVTTGPTTFGLPEARAKLAQIYFRGLGVNQNAERACKLLIGTYYPINGTEVLIDHCRVLKAKTTSEEAG